MRTNGARRGGLALLLSLALFAPGCSKRVTEPDASFQTPEGEANAMLMLGWQEQVVGVYYLGLPADAAGDLTRGTILGTDGFYFSDPSGVRLMAFDGTAANGLQMLRSTANGGLAPLNDYTTQPARKDLYFGTEVYALEDLRPARSGTYFGRGVFNGAVTSRSPLTNPVKPFGPVGDSLLFTSLQVQKDSVLTVTMSQVPGAALYVVELAGAGAFLGSLEAALASAIPAPVLPYRELSTFYFFVPAAQAGIPVRIPIYPARFPLTMLVRISAYDADGRMLSRLNDWSSTDLGGQPDPYPTITTLFPIGGTFVSLDPYNAPGFLPPTRYDREAIRILLDQLSHAPRPAASKSLATSRFAPGASSALPKSVGIGSPGLTVPQARALMAGSGQP